MKIYVSTYKKYNNGNLSGKWLDLEDYDSHDEFIEACNELHEDEADPELMFQDIEDIPNGMVEESSVDPMLWDLLNEDNREIIEAFMDCGYDLEYAMENWEEAYVWEWDSDGDFAKNLCEEMGDLRDIPSHISSHIDWEGVARDIMYDYHSSNGHYFRAL